jgi:hypothetical protein
VSAPGRNDWGPVAGTYGQGPANWVPWHDGDRSEAIPVPRDGGVLGPPPYGMPDREHSSLVRPYAVTGGRTKPRYQLQIEAMVAASHYEARDLSALSPECQAILGFCRDWRSVAEISAVLRMPLGVARVLVADMAVEGLVRIHQTDHEHGRPDLNLLERVLSGLRKL